MLASMTETIRPAFEAAVVLAAAAALVRAPSADSRAGEPQPSRGAHAIRPWAPWLGLFAGVALATAFAMGISTRLLDRELVHGYSTLASFAAGGALLVGLALPRIPGAVRLAIASFTAAALVLPRALSFAAMPLHAASAMPQSDEPAVALSGAALGVVVGLLAAWVLIRLVKRAGPTGRLMMILPFAAVLASEAPGAVNMAFILDLLPITPTLVGLTAPIMNAEGVLFFGVLAAVAVVGLWRVFGRAPVVLEPSNPAEARLTRAVHRRARRTAILTVGVAALTAGVVIGNGIIVARAQAASALTAPTTLGVEGSEVRVKEADVSDGELHRFSVDVDGTAVRFIVVHKGSGLFGTGLDACEICGPTGYYQRGSDVICKACDVVIPIPTIGFEGGCNPIPITYEKRSGELVFEMEQLRAGVGEFE